MWDWQPVAYQFFAYGALGIVSDLHRHRHYALHHEFVAVDGDVVYFLEMGEYPSLL